MGERPKTGTVYEIQRQERDEIARRKEEDEIREIEAMFAALEIAQLEEEREVAGTSTSMAEGKRENTSNPKASRGGRGGGGGAAKPAKSSNHRAAKGDEWKDAGNPATPGTWNGNPAEANWWSRGGWDSWASRDGRGRDRRGANNYRGDARWQTKAGEQRHAANP